eukprot:CAMPEP_0119305962 /NCGR_PEP_ID=MMETSP1333-20130426/6827_1 /TAXON_ID=418940 /ORGANISM="Scyphosphaera apsteinii, Strain RCC1455" /LENGTH=400 /DNA_ID=CAMNT_0007309155 /DNA_START=36 /DNA_END=1238 /DNA_ORIENTATION=+
MLTACQLAFSVRYDGSSTADYFKPRIESAKDYENIQKCLAEDAARKRAKLLPEPSPAPDQQRSAAPRKVLLAALIGRKVPLAALVAGGVLQLWKVYVSRRVDAELHLVWQQLLDALPSQVIVPSMPLLRKMAERRMLVAALRHRRKILAERVIPVCKQLQVRVPAAKTLLDLSLEDLEQLAMRLNLISCHIAPAYAQLGMKVPASLSEKTAEQLRELDATLAARVQGFARVQYEYTKLGQTPPPYLASWNVSLLEERFTNMTTKAHALRRVLHLQKLLGQTRMDWELPAWETTSLIKLATTLEPQVKALQERRQYQELLGKVEAELWLRRLEAPIGLAALSTAQLRAFLLDLKDGNSTQRHLGRQGDNGEQSGTNAQNSALPQPRISAATDTPNERTDSG